MNDFIANRDFLFKLFTEVNCKTPVSLEFISNDLLG